MSVQHAIDKTHQRVSAMMSMTWFGETPKSAFRYASGPGGALPATPFKHACWVGLCLALLFTASCTRYIPLQVLPRGESLRQCEALFSSLDEEARKHGVHNSANTPVRGYPYLRADRFLVAMKDRLVSIEEKSQWVESMRHLDLKSRDHEILNMPEDAVGSIARAHGLIPDRKEVLSRTAACSEKLVEHDGKSPGFFKDLSSRVGVPDEYSSFLRLAGLYPLTSIPVNFISERARRKVSAWFERPLEKLEIMGELATFAPASRKSMSPEEVREILDASKTNPLSIPQPTPDQALSLAVSFAPVLFQDVSAPYDRPGGIVRSGRSLLVDGNRPTIYYYLSQALHRGRPILQLNYVIWYSHRAGRKSPWLERGTIDGLTVRVSLDHDGAVFMVDIMNNCGCYHLFAPRKDEVLKTQSGRCPLGPFVPQWMPRLTSDKTLGIRVNSGWHQVERLLAVEGTGKAATYELLPYETLESLPLDGDRSKSMFNARGIVDESRRIEPYILFPMGIPSVGSMRQRGHHAIDLTCRLHFDDPMLFDKSFLWR